MKISKKTRYKIFWLIAAIFAVLNVIAFFHAYKFTHFADPSLSKTKKPEKLDFASKLKILAFGVNNPRPVNSSVPTQPFKTVKLQSNKLIDCWDIAGTNSTVKGTIILFHGYGGDKSTMLDKSDQFIAIGYRTFLVDFMGSGASEGNQTTIGFDEAEEVKTAYTFIRKRGDKNIYLFGTSMGAVAIMKAINDDDLKPKGILLECPFGSMYKTTSARFKAMNAPTFPMAGLLVFWGGVQNNFWAFGHNPTEYAKKIDCPTLLLYGEKDKNVSRGEIDEIFLNLPGQKLLKTYPLAGHENYLHQYKKEWVADVKEFLTNTTSSKELTNL